MIKSDKTNTVGINGRPRSAPVSSVCHRLLASSTYSFPSRHPSPSSSLRSPPIAPCNPAAIRQRRSIERRSVLCTGEGECRGVHHRQRLAFATAKLPSTDATAGLGQLPYIRLLVYLPRRCLLILFHVPLVYPTELPRHTRRGFQVVLLPLQPLQPLHRALMPSAEALKHVPPERPVAHHELCAVISRQENHRHLRLRNSGVFPHRDEIRRPALDEEFDL